MDNAGGPFREVGDGGVIARLTVGSDDLLRGWRLSLRLRPRLWIVIGVIGLMGLVEVFLGATPIGVPLLLVALVFPPSLFHAARKSAVRNCAAGLSITLSESGVDVVNGERSGRQEWSTFNRVLETEELMVLVDGRAIVVLPRRLLTDAQQAAVRAAIPALRATSGRRRGRLSS